jgi:membrane-bound ClpP family serine protease
MSGKNLNTKEPTKVENIILIIGGVILFIMALAVHDIRPGFGTIMIESVVIAFIGLIVEVIKQFDRKEPFNGKKILKTFLNNSFIFLFLN